MRQEPRIPRGGGDVSASCMATSIPGSPGRNWNDATSLVIQGKAGMQFMGDWAKGEFTAAGLTPGKDYGCTVLSDHGIAYVMGGDVFAFPKTEGSGQDQGAGDARAACCWSLRRRSPSRRRRARSRCGSTSTRARSMSARRRRLAGSRTRTRRCRPTSCCRRPPLTGAVEDVISQYWNDQSMTTDAFIAKVARTCRSRSDRSRPGGATPPGRPIAPRSRHGSPARDSRAQLHWRRRC